MNFQAVIQANGKLIQMFGVLTEVGGATLSSSQKPVCKCKITDDAGESHTVNIYKGKGQLPTPEQLGQRCQFNISTYQGTYQNNPYTGYSGFWNAEAQVGQQAPPQGQQAPSRSAQRPNAKEDVDCAQEQRMIRMNSLNNATAFVTTMAETNKATAVYLTRERIIDIAEQFVKYIYNGIPVGQEDMNTYEEAKAAHESQQSVSEQADDIPF